jgi:hypothetical protein
MMRYAILSLAAIVGFSSAAVAGPFYKPYYKPVYFYRPPIVVVQPSYVVTPDYSDYCIRHGVKFAYGYYYEGFEHRHWSKIYFDPVYNCKIYFDPSTRVEYYWCVPDHRFYPVSYKPYGKFAF